MKDKYWNEYKADRPETIGETDTAFDYGNYVDWLEKQLEKERDLIKVEKKGVAIYCNGDLMIHDKTIKDWSQDFSITQNQSDEQ